MIKKMLLNLVVLSIIVCVSFEAVAQSDIALATKKAELQVLSEKLKNRDKNDRQQVREAARRMGIPVRRELPNGKVLEFQRISPDSGPVFYVTNNIYAADTVSTDEVWSGGSSGLDLDGGGMAVGQWDSGAIADHPDFAGRLTQRDIPDEVSNHSTHVAGTLIGSGAGDEYSDPRSRGMAYAAHLNAYDWVSDTAEMSLAASTGLLVSNHSYGIAAGWLYLGGTPPDNWWWIGGENPSDVEDQNFGYYDSETRLWDQIAFDAPYYLIVKASGNDRTDIGPTAGEAYRVIDQDGTFLFTSTLPRNADCAPAGYDCLPTNSVAKNVLTVGAVDDVIGGYSPFSGPSSVQMADFSGWGPTDDGRIKPDLVGNGMFLISTWADNPYYAVAAGTSMATPNVTGSLLLLQEHYQDIYGASNFMRAATLKALAIHTADEAGDADGPDYAFGWGLLNTNAAAQVITDNGGDHRIIEGNLVNGTVDTVNINLTEPDATIVATLVWTDPPGTPVAPSVDPPDIMLVNDLDLRIRSGASTYMPWVLNPASPAAAATTGDNFRDNVEQVVINGGGAGTYFIDVSHKGALLSGINQNYSLVISVKPGLPSNSSLLIDEDFSGGLPAGWSVDTLSGVDWTINMPVPGNDRLDNWTGGAGNFAMVDVQNNWDEPTITSLRMPAFNLSSAAAVVLRFNSFFIFELLESINVDISTDGGAGWSNVWFHQFFTLPTLYTLDLSGAAAGHASVMLRFRFDGEGDAQGNLWQIDDVELEVYVGEPPPGGPPGQATNPNPADGGSGVGLDAILSWSAGSLATSHDVYFDGVFQGNQPGTTFEPGTLEYSTIYDWRIDEVNANGTTTGNTWNFTTEVEPVLPGPASNPSPINGAADVGVDVDLSWTAGSDATSHDVYLDGVFRGNQPGTTFDPGTLAYATTYNWRIDEVNAIGTTTGIVWSFTTEAVSVPPGPASNPSPINGAADVGVEVDLSWTAGSNAISHNVYFGSDSTPDTGESQGNQIDPLFTPGMLAASTTYYWRIDEVNGDGTTPGAVWSFTTEAVAAPAFQIASIEVNTEPVKGPRNKGVATITVDNGAGSPVAGVVLSGTFSGDWNGTSSGTTGSSGQVVLETPPVKNGSSWPFCVDTASKAGWGFDEASSAGFLCGAPPPPPTTGSIAGVVTDVDTGLGIQGASVSTDTGQSVSTGAEGNYTMTNVPTGTRTVTISASGYAAASQTTSVSDGATSTLNFALTAVAAGGTGTLKGTVRDTSGAKLNGVSLQVVDGPSSTTGKSGRYSIKNVAGGSQSVTASKSGFNDSTATVVISAGSTATLDFSLSPN